MQFFNRGFFLLTHRSGLTEYIDHYYTNYAVLWMLHDCTKEEYSGTIGELIKEVSNPQLLCEIQKSAPTHKIFLDQFHSNKYKKYTNNAKVLNYPVKTSILLNKIKLNKEKKYLYSNSGYLLIAKLMEESEGKNFNIIFQETVAVPAKMSMSFAPLSGSYHDFLKTQHLSNNDGFLGKKEVFIDMANAVGAGNIISTRGDLVKWGYYFFKSSPEGIRKAILRGYGVDPGDGDIINLGLSTDPNLGDLVGHQGSLDSFKSFFGYTPKSDTLIILLSNNNKDMGLLMDNVISWLSS